MTDSAWSQSVKLALVSALAPGQRLPRRMVANAAERAAAAEQLGLDSIDALEADLDISAWFDGAQIDGRWRATVVQICGVSLEPFSADMAGRFTIRAVPRDSALAPRETLAEIIIEPDADDPPDVLEGDAVDLAAYVIEHLALDLDPFPRKPGVEFQPPQSEPEGTPFDVLRALKGGKPGD
jgi:uncharacterized metal-binding protein YceD (DUF177 family)